MRRRRPGGSRQWGPSYRAGGAAALVKVAEAVAKPCNALLAEAVLSARVPVGNAAVALAEMDKLLPRLTPACAETVLGGFVAIAETDGPAQIRALRPRVIARYGRLGEFQRREDLLKHGRSLSQPYADDGMTEYRLRLDPEGQAVLEAILGPLAAPQPSTVRRVGPAHQRPAPRRRAGGGLPACCRGGRRGADHPEGGGGGDDGLPGPEGPDRVRDDADRDLLAPETVRRMACDASIIPAVLGTKSSCWTWAGPAAGHAQAVVALCLRGRGCTFPGCSRPPAWCDAHHGVHWCDGGPDRPDQHGPVVPAAPHDRAPEGLHRHHQHDRGHLAPVAGPAPRPASTRRAAPARARPDRALRRSTGPVAAPQRVRGGHLDSRA